jgi:alkylation response protein AidB-like acyl-CoA dehydrogenase
VSLDEFRRDAAAWFAVHAQPYDNHPLEGLPHEESIVFEREWLRTLNTVGYGAPHVPVEWGGGGYSLREQTIIYEEWARSGAPPVPSFAVSRYHVPSTFLLCGSPAQREQYVADAINGTIWCQGFSEPAAGSDLASLRTSARREGDHFVLNGQKVWSSFAHLARWCLLLARTSSDGPKHKGISYFVLDMHAPGVEVRPIRQASGRSEFNEIFLDEVRIPAANLIGAENDGWSVAQRTLAAERGPLTVQMIERVFSRVQALATEVDAAGHDTGEPSSDQTNVALYAARALSLRALAMDAIDSSEAGVDLPEASSVVNVGVTELDRAVTDLRSARAAMATGLVAPAAINNNIGGELLAHPLLDFLDSWAGTIAGGTNEVQRNIIAERILGLPREPAK